jgi:hypothetical protein
MFVLGAWLKNLSEPGRRGSRGMVAWEKKNEEKPCSIFVQS